VEADGAKIKTTYVPVEAQPMGQLTLHTSAIPKGDRNNAIREKIAEASARDKLLQLVLEGELPFDEYAAIDFAGLFDAGTRGNFHFEYQDRIKVRVPGMELKESGGLHPRRELAELARQQAEKAPPEQKAVWERATKLALDAYDAAEES
jgi:hypothetical protein